MTDLTEYKEVTVRQAFEALKENGFEHLRGRWSAEDIEGVITGGCALQQIALNLGVEGNSRDSQDEEDQYTLANQLNRWVIRKDSRWAKDEYGDVSEYRGLGDIIMEWNDRYEGTIYNNKTGRYERQYTLPTYQDVVNMAEQVLRPHMDKTIKLRTRTWNARKVA